jgi:hypothetical protein
VELLDAVRNQIVIDSEDFVARGFLSTIQVSSIEDLSPPEMIDFKVSVTIADGRSQPTGLVIRLDARDTGSGFDTGFVYHVNIRHYETGSNIETQLYDVGGTASQPTFEGEATFPMFIGNGTYSMDIELVDSARNTVQIGSSELAARGFPSTIQVLSVEDTSPPGLVSFDLSPTVSTRLQARLPLRYDSRSEMTSPPLALLLRAPKTTSIVARMETIMTLKRNFLLWMESCSNQYLKKKPSFPSLLEMESIGFPSSSSTRCETRPLLDQTSWMVETSPFYDWVIVERLLMIQKFFL